MMDPLCIVKRVISIAADIILGKEEPWPPEGYVSTTMPDIGGVQFFTTGEEKINNTQGVQK